MYDLKHVKTRKYSVFCLFLFLISYDSLYEIIANFTKVVFVAQTQIPNTGVWHSSAKEEGA